ncbi:hypothetical protein E2320_004557 [Naja naja]|nr:hypothetical protein E2320_004557 [Naja naja]
MANYVSSGEQPGLGGNAEPLSPPNGAETLAASEGSPGAVADGGGGEASIRSRSLRAVYVVNENPKGSAGARSPEVGALLCLVRACEAAGAQLTTVNFGELDFGETAVLDIFYDADVAVVDMSDFSRQPALFYHLGVRESFDMANNIILYHDTDVDTAQSLKT